MTLLRSLVSLLALGGGLLAQGTASRPADSGRLSLLIVDGQNNHDYVSTTDALTKSLEGSGRFRVTLSRTPPKRSKPEAWKTWNPKFSKYQAVVLDYNGESWPEAKRKEFASYVREGGGVVVVHAANNPFRGWKEFEEMVGLLWRPAKIGRRVTVNDEDGSCICQEPGQGRGAGHGVQHPFKIRIRQPEHPIMKGLPKTWLHAKDELYHGQRGPALRMTVLSSAYSDPKGRGTGAHEPISWVIPFGKGRVFTTVLGHHWWKQKDFDALHCVGFQTVLCRGSEWAATGRVTLGIPAGFPTAEKTSIQKPETLVWPVRQ